MTPDPVARTKALADIAWTAVILGVLAYQARDELRAIYRRKRAELDERRAASTAVRQRVNARRGFLAYLRDRGIEPTTYDLGMETEHA